MHERHVAGAGVILKDRAGQVWELQRRPQVSLLVLIIKRSERYLHAHECLILWSEDPTLKPGEVKAWYEDGFEEPGRRRIA